MLEEDDIYKQIISEHSDMILGKLDWIGLLFDTVGNIRYPNTTIGIRCAISQ